MKDPNTLKIRGGERKESKGASHREPNTVIPINPKMMEMIRKKIGGRGNSGFMVVVSMGNPQMRVRITLLFVYESLIKVKQNKHRTGRQDAGKITVIQSLIIAPAGRLAYGIEDDAQGPGGAE